MPLASVEEGASLRRAQAPATDLVRRRTGGNRGIDSPVEEKREPDGLSIRVYDEPFVLWADNVNFCVGERTILDTSSVTCRSGELSVILGPSGAGKTTLLNLLTGRITAQHGSVGLNDEVMSEAVSKYLINYVMACDRMNEYLTVEETLYHTARLKMPHRSIEECRRMAEELMTQLSILHCRDTLVGGTWRKGISKGEIKRLAVAAELVGNPCCLILDEPTTGLDSSISYELIKILRWVARERNIVVLCTLHQPNQRIFELVDSLILMGGSPGRILYQGAPNNAVAYLRRQGLTSKEDEHAASIPDTVMDMIVGQQSRASADAGTLDHDTSKFSSIDIYQASSICADLSSVQLKSPQRQNTSPISVRREHLSVINKLQPQQQIVEGNYGPLKGLSEIQLITDAQSWFSQFCVCLRSHFTTNRRNPLVIAIILLVNIVQSLLLGCLLFQVDSDMHTVTTDNYLNWSIFQSAPIRFLAYGLTNTKNNGSSAGIIDPLASLLNSGQNLATGSNMPMEIAGNPDLVQWIVDFAKCMRTNFFLDGSQYPRWDWTEGSSTTQVSFAEEPVCWNDNTSYAKTTLGEWSQNSGMSTAVAGAQLFDMLMTNDLQWELPTDKSDIWAWATFQGKIAQLGDAFLCCAGSSTPFNGFTLFPQTCAQTFPHYDLPVFPGRMYWPEFDRELAETIQHLLLPLYEADAALGRNSTAIEPALPLLETWDGHKSASKRKLGSGVGGLLTDLIRLLTENPDSSSYQVLTVLGNIWKRFEDPSCTTRYCTWALQLSAQSRKISSDLFTSLLTVLNICSIVFFLVANLGFSSYDILLQFPQLRAVFNRERANGMYRNSSFLLAKMLADLPFQVVPGLVWALIYWYMTGLDTNPLTVLKYCGVAALTSFTAYSMGYFVGSLVLGLETSIVLSPMILVAMLVLAGFLLRDAEMPSWIAWARYLSIYRWAYFSVHLIQFPPDGSYGPLPNQLNLTLAGVTEQRLWVTCGWLVIISVVCRLACYTCLRFMYTKQGVQA